MNKTKGQQVTLHTTPPPPRRRSGMPLPGSGNSSPSLSWVWVLKLKLIKQIRVKKKKGWAGRRERSVDNSPQNACWGQTKMWLSR